MMKLHLFRWMRAKSPTPPSPQAGAIRAKRASAEAGGAARQGGGSALAAAIAAIAFAATTTSTSAAPALKPAIDVNASVVTVGDMFDDAGALASQPLFLAPAPGTSGAVSIGDIRLAAARAGLDAFDDTGLASVEVSRRGTTVDADALNAQLTDELRRRGLLTGDATLDVAYDQRLDNLEAAQVSDPVRLTDLRYAPDTGVFAARFTLAGIARPLDLTGRLDMMVEVPELVTTLAAGTILKPSDVTMQSVPLRLVQNGNVASIDQLVGQQLVRQSRVGMMLKATDVAPPQLIGRNDPVTVYLHAGAMTLTVKGTALNNAALGEAVAVMNAASKRVIHGVARGDGAVEISPGSIAVAGL